MNVVCCCSPSETNPAAFLSAGVCHACWSGQDTDAVQIFGVIFRPFQRLSRHSHALQADPVHDREAGEQGALGGRHPEF